MRKTIVINRNTWYGRLYLYWRKKSYFKNDKYTPYQENLCHFWRVVTIFAPLHWFFYTIAWFIAALVIAITSNIIWYSFEPHKFLKVWEHIGYFAAIVAAMLLLLVAVYNLGLWLQRKHKPKAEPSFAIVTWHYMVAKKHKVCPLIEITARNTEN